MNNDLTYNRIINADSKSAINRNLKVMNGNRYL